MSVKDIDVCTTVAQERKESIGEVKHIPGSTLPAISTTINTSDYQTNKNTDSDTDSNLYTDNPVNNEINLNEVDKENESYNSDNSVLTFFTATSSVYTAQEKIPPA